MNKVNVLNIVIPFYTKGDEEYAYLTDIIKYKNKDSIGLFISHMCLFTISNLIKIFKRKVLK